MQVSNCLGCLAEKECCFNLGESVFGVLVEEEVALLSVVHEHVDVAFFVEGVPEGDDVGMLHFWMQADLSLDELHFCAGGDCF